MHLIFIPVHAIVVRQSRGDTFLEALLIEVALLRAVAVGADLFLLLATVLVGRDPVRALMHLVVQRVEQYLDKRV